MGAGATRPEAGRLNFIDAYDENFKVNLRRVKRDRQRVDDRKAVLQSGDGKRKALEKALLA